MVNIGYEIIRFIFKISYKKPKVYGVENYNSSAPAVFMCNHEKFYGPIMAKTRFPIKTRTWANSMTTEKEVCKKYIAESLFMGELKKGEKFSRFMGKLMGPLTSWTIRSSNPIVSYWDKERSRKSIRSGVEAIKNGENQLMFGRRREFIGGEFAFMQGFLFICKLASKKHGITPFIYPVAFNRNNSTIAIGKPTTLDIKADSKEEDKRINEYLVNCVKVGYEDPMRMAEAMKP